MHVNYLLKNLKIMGIWNVTRKIVLFIRKKEPGNQNEQETGVVFDLLYRARQWKQKFQSKISLNKRISHKAPYEEGNKQTSAHLLTNRLSPVCTFYRSTVSRVILTYPHTHMSSGDRHRNNFPPVACPPQNCSHTDWIRGSRWEWEPILSKISWSLTVLSKGWLFLHRQYSSLTWLACLGRAWHLRTAPRFCGSIS